MTETGDIRYDYAKYQEHKVSNPTKYADSARNRGFERFDRWLSELIRKEREEAWDEGYGQCWVYHTSEGMQGTQKNPYREEKQ